MTLTDAEKRRGRPVAGRPDRTERPYLFVVKDDMTVEMRRPKVDRIVGGEAVIADGVKPGEKVVTDGQLQLVPGARVQLKQAIGGTPR